ncbi:MAG: pilus assembly protein PilM [Thermoguttaceae bacterium]|nr:pilus assembly protein PilM [Thermoguttaceae bacterium]
MAKNSVVWGIDVGNTSLKAIRCRMGSEPGTVEVIGFDYIEHSKIMSQPGADPNEILAESLALFLSRNNLKGEKVAISVSGQNTLWRFQPLPPIDPKKVTDLIRYEVKQWLPFDLSEVIWDYRQVGGIFEGSIALDLNIFMYAMKRELAFRTLESYSKAGMEVDCLQGAQIALYNGFLYDHYDYDELMETPLDELNDFDVLLNVGTDTTEVVVTNGVVVWLRNIPIGGNMFTKSLTKSLKLTFSNAEHIKRNAATSQDPKAVILAMKPVFNDMLSEVDRSIKYYCSINKRAKIRKIYAYGNAMKLPGLRQFLAKSHGIDVEVVTQFTKLQGAEVLGNAQFAKNSSSFGVAYGLALQLLRQVPLDVNLIPREIVTDRIISAKKPWALAACALLLLALTVQFFSSIYAFSDVENPGVNSAFDKAKQVSAKSQKLITDAGTEVTNFKSVDQIGRNLTSNVEGRLTWLELIKAVNLAIPAEDPSAEILKDGVAPAIKREAIERQKRIYIRNIEVQHIDDLSAWFNLAKNWYFIDDLESKVFEKGSKVSPAQYWYFPPETTTLGEAGAAAAPPPSDSGASADLSSDSSTAADAAAQTGVPLTNIVANVDPRLALIPGPTGPGRIVQLTGYHYHNSDNVNDPERGAEYVRRTILRNLKHGSVELPISLERQRAGKSGTEVVTFKELGIHYPILINPGVIDEKYRLLDPEAAAKERARLMESMLKTRPKGGGMAGMSGMGSMGGNPAGMDASGPGSGQGMPGLDMIAGKLSKDKILNLRRFEFIIHFVWQETPPSIRDLRKKAAAAAAAENAANQSEGSENTEGSASPTAPAGDGSATQPADSAAMPPSEATPDAASAPAVPNAPAPGAPTPAAPNASTPGAPAPATP